MSPCGLRCTGQLKTASYNDLDLAAFITDTNRRAHNIIKAGGNRRLCACCQSAVQLMMPQRRLIEAAAETCLLHEHDRTLAWAAAGFNSTLQFAIPGSTCKQETKRQSICEAGLAELQPGEQYFLWVANGCARAPDLAPLLRICTAVPLPARQGAGEQGPEHAYFGSCCACACHCCLTSSTPQGLERLRSWACLSWLYKPALHAHAQAAEPHDGRQHGGRTAALQRAQHRQLPRLELPALAAHHAGRARRAAEPRAGRAGARQVHSLVSSPYFLNPCNKDGAKPALLPFWLCQGVCMQLEVCPHTHSGDACMLAGEVPLHA